jgi:hypothetical protein
MQPWEMRAIHLNNWHIRNDLGWAPEKSLEDAAKDVMRWFRGANGEVYPARDPLGELGGFPKPNYVSVTP